MPLVKAYIRLSCGNFPGKSSLHNAGSASRDDLTACTNAMSNSICVITHGNFAPDIFGEQIYAQRRFLHTAGSDMHGSDSLLQLLGLGSPKPGDGGSHDELESKPLLPRARSTKHLGLSDSMPLNTGTGFGQSPAITPGLSSSHPGLGGEVSTSAKSTHAGHPIEKSTGRLYPCDPSAYTLLHTAGTGVSSAKICILNLTSCRCTRLMPVFGCPKETACKAMKDHT